MTWENALDNFKTYLTLEKSLSDNSVGAYLLDIKKLAAYCESKLGIKGPEKMTFTILNGYMSYISENGITGRTQARCLSSIRSFFKFLVFDEQIKENPSSMLESPKMGRKLPVILTIEEIDAIKNAVELFKPEAQRNKAMVELLYSCGLRVSELIDAKVSDLNMRTNVLKVKGKGNKERLIPISQEAKSEIKQYFKAYRDYLPIPQKNEDILFLNKKGEPLSRVMIFNIIKDLTKRAGIKKNVSPHTFRHSFASHMIARGADIRAVQEMLGHESILTTEIYTHLDNNYLNDTVKQFHPRSIKNEDNNKSK